MAGRERMSMEDRGEQVYRFFMQYHKRYGVSPSYEDMMKAAGIMSRGHLAKVIDHLVAEGKLERIPGMARGLRLPASAAENSSAFSLALQGWISANNENPMIVMDGFHSDTTLEVPLGLLPAGVRLDSLYLLKVQGHSMIEVGIFNNDYVVMQNCKSCNENDIVAVYLSELNAATLKQYQPTEHGNVRLKARSHKKPTNRIESPQDIEVQGRVVAVLRRCWN